MNNLSVTKRTIYTIGELAQATGVSAKTIRFYEEAGLIPPARRAENGYRLYTDRDAERMRFIRSARALGFAIGDLIEVVAMRDRGQEPCRQVMQRLVLKADEVDEHIHHLQTLQRELKELLATAKMLPLDPNGKDECVCDLISKEPRICTIHMQEFINHGKEVSQSFGSLL